MGTTPKTIKGPAKKTPASKVTEAPTTKAKEAPATLYARLGGVYAIATVMDDFIDRVMNNPILNSNPKVNEAHHRVSPAGFKYLVTELVCSVTGGPQRYSGRPMGETHKDLAINAAQWASFLGDLQNSLDKFSVPAAEQGEIFAIVATTKDDIVIGD